MGVLNWLRQKVASAAGGVFVHQFQSGRPYYPNRNFAALVKRYESYVYACTSKNASSVAEVPLRLYTTRAKGTKQSTRFPVGAVSNDQRKHLEKRYHRKFATNQVVEEVFDHPIIDLLTNVNPHMNQFEMFELLVLAEELTGNAYWLIGINEQLGVPTEIWPLFPQLMKVIPSRENFIQGWEYKIGSEKIIFSPEEIIQFKYPNPKDPFYGMGPMEASVLAADLGVSMNIYETQNFKNAGHIDMAMVLPADGTPPNREGMKKLQSDWKRKFTGLGNVGKMPFLSGGGQLVNLQFSPKDMGFLKGRKASLEEVAAVFGVPLSKLTVENVNRANAEAGNFSYQKDTILPKLKRIEQKLNEQFVPLWDSSLFLAFDNPVPEDKEFRLKEAASRLGTGQTTINEERLIDNLDPVEYGDIPILSGGMRPLGSETEQVVPDKDDAKKTKGIRIGFAAPNFTDDKFVAALSEYFRSMEDEILINFDENEAAFKSVSKASVEEELAASWFDFQKWNRELEVIETPFLRAHLLAGGTSAVNKLGREIAFEMETPQVIRAISDHRISTVSSVNSTALKKLRKTIADGILEGEGAEKIRKRLQATFDGMSKDQALLLARTETIWAWNEGAVQGFKQSGVITTMVWVATGDERTCEFCPEMDGVVISVDGKFWDKGDSMTGNQGGTMNFHYEKVAHPPLHPLCRCTIAPEIENI